MLYNKFQLIAYRTVTSAGTDAGKVPTINADTKKKLEEIKVEGLVLSEDLKARLYRMVRLLEFVHADESPKKIVDSPSTLKIFMAPEFYFRPKVGETGADDRWYSDKEKEYLLRALGAVPKKEKWLYVFGTVVWKQNDASTQEKLVVWNTAIVHHGEQREVHKRDYAGADGIDKEYSPWKVGTGATIGALKQAVDVKRTVFQVGDLWTGLEICADHMSWVARSGARAKARAMAKPASEKLMKEGLHFQILTACGMRANPDSAYLEAGRPLVRVDGDGTTKFLPMSEIVRVFSSGGLTATKVLTKKKEEEKKEENDAWDADNQVTLMVLPTTARILEGDRLAIYNELPLLQPATA